MICFKCNKETPDSQLYCKHCGAKLDFTFEQIGQNFSEQIQTEKVQETEEFFRWILVMIVFVLVTSWLFGSMWTNPPEISPNPGYIPHIEIPEHVDTIHEPLLIKE